MRLHKQSGCHIMTVKATIPSSLNGRTVALAESRQLDVLADLFERRGATVIRLPLVTILDSPDRDAVEAWLRKFIDDPPDYLVILTGEGVRRLAGFARRAGCRDAFVEALARVTKICRGPKPGRALKELGLKPDLQGKQPTTAGIIATLEDLSIKDSLVAVQLYGEDPNLPLMNYLQQRGARVTAVAPYVYSPDTDAERIGEFIDKLHSGTVDIIAFTSQPQFNRLLKIAVDGNKQERLFDGLNRTLVAAVGPVVRQQLAEHDVRVAVSPADSYFMKPMLRAIEQYLDTSD